MNLAHISHRLRELSLTHCLLPLLLALSMAAGAQVEDEDTERAPDTDQQADDAEALQEIVVVGERPGDPRRLDNAYENALRQRILEEIDELEALEEEFDWRRAARRGDDESRIRWGYDPRDEYRARRESELYDLPLDNNRPAKIFSIEF